MNLYPTHHLVNQVPALRSFESATKKQNDGQILHLICLLYPLILFIVIERPKYVKVQNLLQALQPERS